LLFDWSIRAERPPNTNDLNFAHAQVATAMHAVAILEGQMEALSAEIAVNPSLPGVLYAGDTVRLPQAQHDVTLPSVVNLHPSLEERILAVTGAPATEEDRLFGVDLLLNNDGNMEWDKDAKDFRLERGLQHMANVQVRYVKLPLGQLRYAPSIGNFAY